MAVDGLHVNEGRLPSPVVVAPVQKPRALVVEVQDTGPGIEEEDRDKIFEPFYTTKPVGEGTGLGLSVTRNIIHLHEGSIDIFNREEGGASVIMMFKLSEGDV